VPAAFRILNVTAPSGPVVVLLVLLGMLFGGASEVRAQAGGGGGGWTVEEAHYLEALSRAFGITEQEGARLTGEGLRLDELPVVLHLARETGLAPSGILALRRAGASWGALALRAGVPWDRIVVPLPEGVGSPRAQTMARRLALGARDGASPVVLEDEEVTFLVHLRVLQRHFEFDVAEILRVEALSPGSWVGVVRRLTPGEGAP
jgi:hypothetical protein